MYINMREVWKYTELQETDFLKEHIQLQTRHHAPHANYTDLKMKRTIRNGDTDTELLSCIPS